MDQDAKIAYLEQLLDRTSESGYESESGSDSDSLAETPAAERRREHLASPPIIVAPPRDAEGRYRDRRGPLLYFALLALIPLISVALWLLAPPRAAFEEPVPQEWASQPNAASAPTASPLAQAPAALRVTSDPEGPFVYIDGVLIGISPYLTDTLTAGWRVVSLEMAGYATRDTLLYVAPAMVTTLTLTLDSLVAVSVPATEPEQPTIEESESEARPAAPTVETTPEPVVEAPPPAAPRQPMATEVPDESVSDERSNSSAAPVSETGTLSVLVRPWGSIYVDDVRKAQDTDLRWAAEVPVGLRTVRVVHPVLGVQQHSVEVQADETTSLVIDLY